LKKASQSPDRPYPKRAQLIIRKEKWFQIVIANKRDKQTSNIKVAEDWRNNPTKILWKMLFLRVFIKIYFNF